MSLVDSLLLDPSPFHVWIAQRFGTAGSGTINDPYDGTDAAQFDGIMNNLASLSGVTVHLGPGSFQTAGYAIGSGSGWQAKAGMKIIGSGIDVTTLVLINTAANEHYYAIGHPLTSMDKANYFQVSDLTIDCNLPGGVSSVACGAIRIMGDHVKVQRVKAINWGTTDGLSTGRRCYVFSVITAWSSSIETVNAGIEDCLATQPSSANKGKSIAIHVGSQEDSALTAEEGFGKSPYLRNCFVDSGTNPDPDPDNWIYHGLSMGWCRGGVVEGNQVYNTEIGGPYQDKRSTRDIIVRNNFFKNVARGPNWNLGTLGSSISLSSLIRPDPDPSKTAEATTSSNHLLAKGDRVKVSNASETPFNGVFVVTEVPAANKFRYEMLSRPSADSAAGASAQKVFGLSRAVIEGNVVELATAAELTLGPINVLPLISFGTLVGAEVTDLAAVWVDDNNQGTGADYVHGDIIIRNNKSRYVDGLVPTGTLDVAVQVNGAKNVIVSNNVIDSANAKPLQNRRCSSAKYLNNLAPNGALRPGFNADLGIQYSEPATDAEEAFLLALLDRRRR